MFFIHYSNQSWCHMILFFHFFFNWNTQGKAEMSWHFFHGVQSHKHAQNLGENKYLHKVCKSNMRSMALI